MYSGTSSLLILHQLRSIRGISPRAHTTCDSSRNLRSEALVSPAISISISSISTYSAIIYIRNTPKLIMINPKPWTAQNNNNLLVASELFGIQTIILLIKPISSAMQSMFCVGFISTRVKQHLEQNDYRHIYIYFFCYLHVLV